MPPLCGEEPCFQYIGRRSRVRSKVTRPTLLIGETLDNEDDDANDSDENVSPDAEKSEIRFTLERKQFNSSNDDKSDGDGRDRSRKTNDFRDQDNFNRDDPRNFFHDFDGSNRGGGSNDDSNDDNDNGFGFGRGGRGGGRGGNKNGSGDGNNSSGNDRDGSNPGTTSTTSAAEASTTTTTPVKVSTSVLASETVVSSATQDTGKASLTPAPALADPSPAAQPTQVIPTTSVVRNPESALAASSQTTTSVSTPVIPDSGPAQTSTTNNNNNNNNNNRPFGKYPHNGFGKFGNGNFNGGTREKGLNPTSERILIAAGSVGAFIVFCFIGWIVYRTLKKPKPSGRSGSSDNWLSKLIPWRGRSATSSAQTADSFHEPKEPAPTYDASTFNSMQAAGYYGQEKPFLMGLEDTAYPSTANLQDERSKWQTPDGQPAPANPQNQFPQSNGQTLGSGDVNSTLRSRMPDPYYNQSELARQPSDAYNPAQRQVYRASEISSLSSGFGDGDIIMPPPATIPKIPIAQAQAQAQAANMDTSNPRLSWMSRNGGNEPQRRDTVYTAASDRPTRFRSITSWVDQQKTRMKRADSKAKARGEVPVMPAMPGLINVTQQTAYK
ncbi:hypothetical protein HD806DRAFT_528643 [Xylariaceae sp. AK1471]|nr:hypothetical protein HD806DRAFT_528643 [Xylariaceae sp. AK1471]